MVVAGAEHDDPEPAQSVAPFFGALKELLITADTRFAALDCSPTAIDKSRGYVWAFAPPSGDTEDVAIAASRDACASVDENNAVPTYCVFT